MIDANSQFFAILTQVGEAKQANADALGRPWLITEMGVGDANGTDPVPDRLQTRLINEWRRQPLNQLKVDPVNPAVIIAEQIIPADEGGKWIREIGLYDADGDLVAVANCAPSFKPVLSQGSGRTQIVRMNLIVSSAGNITLKIDPAVVLATRSYVDNVFASIIEVYAQKTPYDGTPGKLAKVGYMGWGSSYVNGPQLFGDMTGDQTIFSGLYRYSPQTIGHPGFGSGYGSVLQASLSSAGGNWGTQLVIDYAFDAIGFRRLSGPAGWQPFQEIWHRGNLKAATQDQTNSGIDDTTFVTPKKFAAGLSALIIQASEAIKGIARVATQSHINSGVDDATFVTPKKLRWGFQVLKAQQGYVVFPTWLGGFVVQWGYASIPGVATAVPFALSYPSACYAVVPMVINSSVGADTVELTHAPTKNSFTSAVVSSGASGPASQVAGAFYWLSVGF